MSYTTQLMRNGAEIEPPGQYGSRVQTIPTRDSVGGFAQPGSLAQALNGRSYHLLFGVSPQDHKHFLGINLMITKPSLSTLIISLIFR